MNVTEIEHAVTETESQRDRALKAALEKLNPLQRSLFQLWKAAYSYPDGDWVELLHGVRNSPVLLDEDDLRVCRESELAAINALQPVKAVAAKYAREALRLHSLARRLGDRTPRPISDWEFLAKWEPSA